MLFGKGFAEVVTTNDDDTPEDDGRDEDAEFGADKKLLPWEMLETNTDAGWDVEILGDAKELAGMDVMG